MKIYILFLQRCNSSTFGHFTYAYLLMKSSSHVSLHCCVFFLFVTVRHTEGFFHYKSCCFLVNLQQPIITYCASAGWSHFSPDEPEVLKGSSFAIVCSTEPQFPGGSFHLEIGGSNISRTQPAVNHSAAFLFPDGEFVRQENYICTYEVNVSSRTLIFTTTKQMDISLKGIVWHTIIESWIISAPQLYLWCSYIFILSVYNAIHWCWIDCRTASYVIAGYLLGCENAEKTKTANQKGKHARSVWANYWSYIHPVMSLNLSSAIESANIQPGIDNFLACVEAALLKHGLHLFIQNLVTLYWNGSNGSAWYVRTWPSSLCLTFC